MLIVGWGGDVKELGPGPLIYCQHCNNTRRWRVVQARKKVTLFFVPVAKWSAKYFMACPVCLHGVEFETREEAQKVLAKALQEAGGIHLAGE
jgi:hypothetical protein